MAITVPSFILDAPLLNLDSLGQDFGSSLILAPHPDDESLGCGGLISILRQQNTQVFIAFITDGAASHPNSQLYPPSTLASLRKSEAVSASHQLGIQEGDLYFLDQPDGRLFNVEPESFNALAEQLQELISTLAIQSLIVPYQRDAHSDHRMTWKLAIKAADLCDRYPIIVEYPIWFWKNGTPDDVPDISEYNFFRLDITSVIKRKQLAVAEHKSQTTRLIDDDPDGFILTPDLLKPFMGNVEYFFFRKMDTSGSLTEDYFDKLYHKRTDPWDFERSHYEHSKYKTTLAALNESYGNSLEIGCSIGVLTEQLAARCSQLLALDISELPLITARKRCAYLDNVKFAKMDISKNFPQDHFDLILISEVGYYLSKKDLNRLFEHCASHLNHGGHLLMVHWTSFVSEYPLTGTEVHELFKKSKLANEFTCVNRLSPSGFELVLWEKTGAS